MELTVFVRFHVAAGNEQAAADALRAQMPPVRAEAGCISIRWHRGTQDPRLFFVYSQWQDNAAFELHLELAHTIGFLATMEKLIDQPRELARTVLAG